MMRERLIYGPGRVIVRTKYHLRAVFFSLLVLFPVSAFSASGSATLVVQVTAVTGSCTPMLDTPVVDMGKIDYGSLNVSVPTTLTEKSVRLTITCSSPMAVGWTITDNRADSVARFPVVLQGRMYDGTALAGLGKTRSGVATGAWTISTGTVGSLQHDGANGTAIVSADQGKTWAGTPGVPVAMNFTGAGITSVSDSGTVPVPFVSGDFLLSVGAIIAPRNMLKLADDTRLDGSATISLVYL